MVTRLIRAAGGIILRPTKKGRLKVLLAHRPRYDDWSFPKGKADDGETPEETAIREVWEETGYKCRIVAPIGTTRYRVTGGIKEVNWFAMRPLPESKGFEPNSEVDEIRWLGRGKAKTALDYEHDRDLMADNDLKKLAATGTIHLLRHAAAGNRAKWEDDDTLRPLTKTGIKQAQAIAERLARRNIERVITSPYQRCVQTVQPLAGMIGAKIEVTDILSEEPDLDAVYGLVDSLVGNNAVLCSHGDVIPGVVNHLMWAGLTIESRFYCPKGSTWEVEVDGGRFTTGTYVPPPEV